MTPTETLVRDLRARLAPPPRVSVSEWADRERRLSSEASAEPGRWRTDRAEYQRGIMDASRDPTVHTVVIQSSAQVGKTEILLNALGYSIDLDPGPTLGIYPTLEMAQAFSKDRLSPMLRDTPALSGRVHDERTRIADQTLLRKSFEGGHLTLAGANSPVSLASRPIRFLFADDVDRFPPMVGGEGDPLSLGIKRTTTFWNRKIFIASTPTVKGISRIESWYQLSDRRRFFVPCPRCEELFCLEWPQVRWTAKDPSTAHLVCSRCEGRIENHERTAMVRAGVWRATAPFTGIAGFALWEGYSPWVSLSELATKFLEANQQGRESLRVFINTALGETWEERGEAPDWERLMQRREPYPIGTVPAGALFLTAGVDVQKDRLIYEVVGWGRGKASWSIDYGILPGDTADLTDKGPWPKLDALLERRFPHEDGPELPVAILAVDSGYNTQQVYGWARHYPLSRVIATKGQDHGFALVGAPTPVEVSDRGRKLKRGYKVWTIATPMAKSELYGWLRLQPPTDESPEPPGFCHFPQYGEEYFRQLTAEQLVPVKDRRGFVRLEWGLIGGRENHVLDCRVLARAAANVAGLDRFQERDWAAIERTMGRTRTAGETVQAAETPAPASPPAAAPRRESWLRRGTRDDTRRGWFGRR